MNAYNANTEPCAGYWGHLGRSWTTQIRTKPISRHIGILVFTTYQFFKGFICMFAYPQMERPTLPDDTLENILRSLRISSLNFYVLTAGIPLVFVIFYVIFSVVSILYLFGGFFAQQIAGEGEKEAKAGEKSGTWRRTSGDGPINYQFVLLYMLNILLIHFFELLYQVPISNSTDPQSSIDVNVFPNLLQKQHSEHGI